MSSDTSTACCVDPGTKQSGSVTGKVEQICDVPTYVTGSGQPAIVVFTDIFGFGFINIRQVADEYASSNFTVYIPDLFNGDPMNHNDTNLMDKLPAWIQKHPPLESRAFADKFIAAIEQKHQSIQVVGFCYGATPVVHICKQDKSKVKAGVVAHPSFIQEEEAEKIQRPMLFVCAEQDQRFTPELRQHYEQVLTKKALGTFIDYPGTVHGFAVRTQDTDQAKEQKKKATKDTIEFFKKHA
ncbi:unnamed protein product [Didymodactylos carnosus]|uniref:Dienelactone hydrolase domain-containing protein n=1 Tax=Didymodactylos carnosus TaxID=1234261 RepID=A0A814BRT9_9BILA|nr:unnamed protein product [Didymodactylos carnosus]CAF1201561.1 unnamed protein product [Didymodactylos carnosus]CAF3708375.1 unnamed protein product [Didymodactylos carnosus]CAF4011480.1 unnamed protein product [Didymodactylos carnosus]